MWDREIQKFETFLECSLQFAGSEDRFWALFKELDIWGGVFRCRIPFILSVLCDHQMKYLIALNRCLDLDLFRCFIRSSNAAQSYVKPLMTYIVQTNFNEPETFDKWDDSSRLAFAAVCKMFAQDINYLTDLTNEELGQIWTNDEERNVQKLRQSIGIFLLTAGQEKYHIRRSIVECNDCLPQEDYTDGSERRTKRMAVLFRLPDTNDQELLNSMRPFLVNLLSPAIEDQPGMMDLIAMSNQVCAYNFSRHLLHDAEIIKGWSELVLNHRPSCWDAHIKCLFDLLRRPSPQDLSIDPDTSWFLFNSRVAWFCEKYCELFYNDLKVGIDKLIDTDEQDDIKGVIMYTAILNYHGLFQEKDQLELISAVTSLYYEFAPGTKESELSEFCVALMQLCLSKEICTKLVLLDSEQIADIRSWIQPDCITPEVMDQSVFKYLRPDTPFEVFQAAVCAAQVAIVNASPDLRPMIRTKGAIRLKAVIKEPLNSNSELAAETLATWGKVKKNK